MIDREAALKCQRRWDNIAKPLHSLGHLERLVCRLAGIQGSPDVRIDRRVCLVVCADNGVVAEGVSQAPAAVTALQSASIARGQGSVNAMARAADCDVVAVDVGILSDVEEPKLIRRKAACGTASIVNGPAMTPEQLEQTLKTGMDLVGEMKARGYQIICTGEMGIGNTTTTAAVGGFDIAALAGIFLGGALHRMPIVLDGVISSVSALLAVRIDPACRDYLLASHLSREPAAGLVMDCLGLSPVLHADLALGEGTGAVALLPLLDQALAVYHQNSTFDQLQIEPYRPQHPKP